MYILTWPFAQPFLYVINARRRPRTKGDRQVAKRLGDVHDGIDGTVLLDHHEVWLKADACDVAIVRAVARKGPDREFPRERLEGDEVVNAVDRVVGSADGEPVAVESLKKYASRVINIAVSHVCGMVSAHG